MGPTSLVRAVFPQVGPVRLEKYAASERGQETPGKMWL
jgi:hypothetical protein